MKCPHPDYLLPWLTWEQFSDWRNYWCQEPWGDIRADAREAANTIWLAGVGHDQDSPSLVYPYFEADNLTPAERIAKHRELEQKCSTPEYQERLKAARRKYLDQK